MDQKCGGHAAILSMAQESNSQKGETTQEDPTEVDVQALHDILLANATMEAQALSSAVCGGGNNYMQKLEKFAPGCLDPCVGQGACGAVGHAIDIYMSTKDQGKVQNYACQHQGPFKCLLGNSAKCRTVLSLGKRYGLPQSEAQMDQKCGAHMAMLSMAEEDSSQ